MQKPKKILDKKLSTLACTSQDIGCPSIMIPSKMGKTKIHFLLSKWLTLHSITSIPDHLNAADRNRSFISRCHGTKQIKMVNIFPVIHMPEHISQVQSSVQVQGCKLYDNN